MFRRCLPTLAMALIAITPLLTPAQAPAQGRVIYGSISPGRPNYSLYAPGYYPLGRFPYSYTYPGYTGSALLSPFAYRDPVTAQAYNLTLGGSAFAPYTSGLVSPYGYRPWNYVGFRGSAWPYGFNAPYAYGGYGYGPGYYGAVPNYVGPAPGLTDPRYAPVGPGAAWYTVGGPTASGDLAYATPKSRTSFYPAVPVTPGSALPAQALGGSAVEAPAYVEVTVPTADAEIWFQGVKTTRTGTRREFVSPPLQPNSNYTYEVRASWREGGETRTATRNVRVRAGDIVRVDFTKGEGKP